MREDNILKQEMLKDEYEYTAHGKVKIDVRDFKTGDIVSLKDDKYAKIISDGEYCDDIDYGEMYKNIKRFEYIDKNTYHLLYLEKRRNEHEEIILKNKKEMYQLDLLIYLNKNRVLITDEYDGKLHDEFRTSEKICKMEDIGSFYKTDEGIKQMSTPGYNWLFYKINLPEEQLTKIANNYNNIMKATESMEIPYFKESIK